MKLVADRIPDAGPFAVLLCPVCGERTVYNEAMPWCAKCCTEYYRTGRIGRARYIFDTERKTPRFALAKAVNKVGGLKIATEEP